VRRSVHQATLSADAQWHLPPSPCLTCAAGQRICPAYLDEHLHRDTASQGSVHAPRRARRRAARCSTTGCAHGTRQAGYTERATSENARRRPTSQAQATALAVPTWLVRRRELPAPRPAPRCQQRALSVQSRSMRQGSGGSVMPSLCLPPSATTPQNSKQPPLRNPQPAQHEINTCPPTGRRANLQQKQLCLPPPPAPSPPLPLPQAQSEHRSQPTSTLCTGM
jgi:hypothetical protein